MPDRTKVAHSYGIRVVIVIATGGLDSGVVVSALASTKLIYVGPG